jgi:arginine dihydrolase
MRKLLLCPPDHYGIEYEINPWMDCAHNALPEVARAQWQKLHDALNRLAARSS